MMATYCSLGVSTEMYLEQDRLDNIMSLLDSSISSIEKFLQASPYIVTPVPTPPALRGANGGTIVNIIQNPYLAQLYLLHQTSTVDEFQQHFETIRTHVSSEQPELPEDFFTSLFINGLCPEVRTYVPHFHPCTTIDAYDVACIYEYSLRGVQAIPTSVAPSTNFIAITYSGKQIPVPAIASIADGPNAFLPCTHSITIKEQRMLHPSRGTSTSAAILSIIQSDDSIIIKDKRGTPLQVVYNAFPLRHNVTKAVSCALTHNWLAFENSKMGHAYDSGSTGSVLLEQATVPIALSTHGNILDKGGTLVPISLATVLSLSVSVQHNWICSFAVLIMVSKNLVTTATGNGDVQTLKRVSAGPSLVFHHTLCYYLWLDGHRVWHIAWTAWLALLYPSVWSKVILILLFAYCQFPETLCSVAAVRICPPSLMLFSLHEYGGMTIRGAFVSRYNEDYDLRSSQPVNGSHVAWLPLAMVSMVLQILHCVVPWKSNTTNCCCPVIVAPEYRENGMPDIILALNTFMWVVAVYSSFSDSNCDSSSAAISLPEGFKLLAVSYLSTFVTVTVNYFKLQYIVTVKMINFTIFHISSGYDIFLLVTIFLPMFRYYCVLSTTRSAQIILWFGFYCVHTQLLDTFISSIIVDFVAESQSQHVPLCVDYSEGWLLMFGSPYSAGSLSFVGCSLLSVGGH